MAMSLKADGNADVSGSTVVQRHRGTEICKAESGRARMGLVGGGPQRGFSIIGLGLSTKVSGPSSSSQLEANPTFGHGVPMADCP